jgi:hypothetical protein
MQRTVLYYPTISIPDDWWLRQALFYFDQVASIVPQKMTWEGESLGILSPLQMTSISYSRNASSDLFHQNGLLCSALGPMPINLRMICGRS